MLHAGSCPISNAIHPYSESDATACTSVPHVVFRTGNLLCVCAVFLLVVSRVYISEGMQAAALGGSNWLAPHQRQTETKCAYSAS
jgi:hypothetical protein